VSVRPSVRLSVRFVRLPAAARAHSSKAAAAGVLLCARRAGDIDRLLHGRRSAAPRRSTAPLLQMRAVAR